jgi:hypothetical protein
MSLLKLIFDSWRPWYLWAVLVAASIGFWPLLVMAPGAVGKLEACIAACTAHQSAFVRYYQLREIQGNLENLVVLKFIMDGLPGHVLLPAVLAGYGGFSLDLLYRRWHPRVAKQKVQ